MVVRTAKKGTNVGRTFYVCTRYLECKGKVPIRKQAGRIPFHWYAGQQLASLLPYRKRGLIFGPKVCEWPAVMPMAKGAFFLGCSLALANKSAAEGILTEAAKAQPWKTEFSEAIRYLDRGRAQSNSVDTATLEDFYPELTSDKFKGVLLTQEECVGRVGGFVIPRLIPGVLYPEMASSMLKTWATQQGEWKDLGVGGLRVADFPLLASVEEACERALSVYEAWQSE